jgi:hypothetical protein
VNQDSIAKPKLYRTKLVSRVRSSRVH